MRVLSFPRAFSYLLQLIFIGCSPAYALCSIPYQITNGQPADANQIMADLNALGVCSSPAGSPGAIQLNGGNTFSSVGPLTNGQILVGITGSAPQAATIAAGTGIAVTTAPGSLTISTVEGNYNVPLAADVTTIGNPTTTVDAIKALKIVTAAVGNDKNRASIVTKSVSGSWSARIKLKGFRQDLNFAGWGIAAYESSTSKTFALQHQMNSYFSGQTKATVRSDYGPNVNIEGGSTPLSGRAVVVPPEFFKIEVKNAIMNAYTSLDGDNWDLQSSITISTVFSSAPDSVGVFVEPWYEGGLAEPVTVYCYDFRIE